MKDNGDMQLRDWPMAILGFGILVGVAYGARLWRQIFRN